MTTKQPIGAHVCIKWLDQLHLPHAIEGAYVLLGEYDEENETDSFGTPDESILYYANGIDELKQLMDADKTPSDFVITSYELEYRNEQI
jgi:hypothetical protein